jgi:hypothetical protein
MDKFVSSVNYKGIDFDIYQAGHNTNFEFNYENWFYVVVKSDSWYGYYLSNDSQIVDVCTDGWTETIQEAFLKIANYE